MNQMDIHTHTNTHTHTHTHTYAQSLDLLYIMPGGAIYLTKQYNTNSGYQENHTYTRVIQS